MGRFISFEGVEGSGKSTLASSLATSLTERGHEVVRVREPGGTRLGEAARSLVLDPALKPVDAKAELFLMLTARAQLVQEVVEPALARGAVVFCDRYADASVAYQGYARKLGASWVQQLNAFATGGRQPDRTYLLDLDPEVGRSRQSGAPDRMESEGLDFHQRVRQGYLEMAAAEPDRFLVLDAMQSPGELFTRAWEDLVCCLGEAE